MDKSPHEIAEEVVKLSSDFSTCSEQYAHLYEARANFFNKERENHKSDNATMKAFDVTPEGIRMSQLKAQITSLDKKMSAYKAYLRVMETEARNQF